MMVLLVSCSEPQAKPSVQPGVSAPSGMEFDGQDDVLRIAMVKPGSANPADLVLTDQAQVILSDLLYDGLTEVEANSGRLRPGLATSWISNRDFTSWTFTLDSDRLTAEQVKSSFERQGNQQSAVVRQLMSIVDSIEVLSEFEVRFDLLASSAGFPWLISGPGMAVTTENDVPTGRLNIISEDNNGMILVSPDGLSDIDIRWTATEQDAYALLDSDGVDVAIGSSQASASAPALGHVRFVAINSESALLADANTRMSVRSTIGSITSAREGSISSVVEIDGLSSPALAGSTSLVCEGSCTYRPEQGATTPIETQLRLGVGAEVDLEVAESIQRAFADSTIEIEIVSASPDRLAAMISAGEIDLSVFGWVAGASSVDAVVPSLLQSKAPGNIFQLRDDEIDRLLLEASKIGDDQRRWDLISEAETRAISSDVIVPLGAIRSKVRTNEKTTSLVIRADGTLDTFRY